MNEALEEELSRPLDGTVKGVPYTGPEDARTIATRDVAREGWNLLEGDLPFPSAVILESALRHNLKWMRRFTDEMGVRLAPHGKTTMAPQLFHLQLAQGAWGITVATVQQMRVCRRFGVDHVLLANQLVHRGDIEYVVDELQRDPGLEFYCLVDSAQGIECLERVCASRDDASVNVLLEVGVEGGRSGCRSLAGAVEVLDAVSRASRVKLCGIECYEGIGAGGDHAKDLARVDRFLRVFGEVYRYCRKLSLFDSSGSVVLSAGGSAYFDVVARGLVNLASDGVLVLIRSGCYITHDSKFYRRMAEWFAARHPERDEDGNGLRSALKVWGRVLSVPEPGLAILGVGKRDVSHDIDLPVPEVRYRPGANGLPRRVDSSWRVADLNDHHAYLVVPNGEDVAVGDLLGLGVSHPCTTFDKWRMLWMVDDAYRVTGAIWTYF